MTEALATSAPAGARVVVSGAAGGIGAAIVDALEQAGCAVGACDRHEPPAGRARAAFDVADRAATDAGVATLIDSLGGCDAVVACAGVVDTIHRAERFPAQEWEADLGVNLTGQFHLVRACFAALSAAEGGRVVLVSSASAETGLPGQAAYTAAKAGLTGLARTLAAEWAPHAIAVNVVMPGMVATPKVLALPGPVREALTAQIPAGRLADPAELAGTVSFLLSPAAAYVNGAVLRVDGGLGLVTTGLHRR